MKHRFSIKFDQRKSGIGNPNLLSDFQNFELDFFSSMVVPTDEIPIFHKV